MPEREKVIRGLIACKNHWCAECSYAMPGMKCCGRDQMFDNALALLKEQKPRVMTLKEIRTGEIETLWIEVEGKPHIFPGIWYRCSKKDGIPAIDITLNTGIVRGTVVSYGYAWRCWTSRPTEEQRQNTPWEPPKEEDDARSEKSD